MQRAREYIKSGTGIAKLLDTFPRNTTVRIGMLQSVCDRVVRIKLSSKNSIRYLLFRICDANTIPIRCPGLNIRLEIRNGHKILLSTR